MNNEIHEAMFKTMPKPPEGQEYHMPPGATQPQLRAKVVTEDVEAAAEAPQLKGKLPEDFPHHSLLAEAGINTYAQVRKAQNAGWEDVAGIGEGRAADIAEALNQSNPEEEEPE